MASEDEDSTQEETVYLYRIPLETEDGVQQPAYTPYVNGQLYLYHYGGNHLYVIQEKAAGHLHKSDVNVQVRELPKSEVESSENLVEEYT